MEIKVHNFEGMSIEEIADIAAELNTASKAIETQLDKAKTVVKARYKENEISKLSAGKDGEIEIREADDFHDIDPVEAFKAMDAAGHGQDFPLICSIQLNDSGKKAKVKKLGITHFLANLVVDKLRKKKREKALTVYFRYKKKD